jgi:hypothetical protein
MDRPPHLTLVDPQFVGDHDQEFVPLPYYGWEERPPTLQLDHDECATAIHLAGGDLPKAASLLKVPLVRLHRSLRHSLRLQRILEETQDLAVARASAEYLRALDAPDDRRREWGASKIMQSRAAMGHPFSPAPAASAQSNVTINQQAREIVFSWRSSPGAIEGGGGDGSGD